jgi:beta-fructofuranosidase
MVLGARDKDSKGCILVYKSNDLYNWTFHSIPAGGEENMGYMWECPDIFKLSGKDVFMFSPQGLEEEGHKYKNVYQSGYSIGKFIDDKKKLELDEFVEIDRGFDFYAPQTFEDNKGRRIMIGWMGVPDAVEHENPTIENFWQHQLTIPRELVLNGDKLYQIPVKELETLRKDFKEIKDVSLLEEVTLELFESNTFELKLDFENSTEFIVEFREDCKLSFKDGLFKLELGKSGYGRDERAVEIKSIDKLRIFSDNSSLEIFLNDGEEVFTTRIYNNQADKFLKIKGNGTVSIKKWNI